MIKFANLKQAKEFLVNHRKTLNEKISNCKCSNTNSSYKYAISITDKIITFIEENTNKFESTILFQTKRYCNRYKYSMMLDEHISSTGE